MSYPEPEAEDERLQALKRYEILDTPVEEIYDQICELASHIAGTEMAAITIVDEDRQWFKSQKGLGMRETPRDQSFCTHVIADDQDVMTVADALDDDRFEDNPLVTGEPNIRFYAGAEIETPDGHPLGTICAIHDEPHQLTEAQKEALETLADQVMILLEFRRRGRELDQARREIEEQARELELRNETLSNYASLVSHEVRKPLSAVSSQLDLLKLEKRDQLDEEGREMLDQAFQGSRDLEALLSGLQRYAEAAEIDVQRDVDAGAALERALSHIEERVESSGAEVHCDGLPRVDADEVLLTQVFRNLVDNAIKHHDGEPVIEVRGRREGDEVVFEVVDDGPGLDPGDEERIFELFQQVSAGSEGLGLGLSLCKRVVESHGGQIGLDSTPGEGTTVWFRLPDAEA